MPAEPGAARLLGLPLRSRGAALVVALAFLASGCARTPPTPAVTERASAPLPAPRSPEAAPSAEPEDAGPTTAPQLDADGDDDPEDTRAEVPVHGELVKVGTPPLALTRICDLTPLGDALYAAHANQPLGTDGATITRYRPDDEKRPFSVAFDWNRPGEPTKGGGAGQGFTRVHAIGGRLFVPDADPPYGGLGLVDWGTEGYVFASDARGAFAPPRAPHFRPPAAPDLRDPAKAGAGVLPRAYHVLDVVRFRGAFFASTGSVPPKERAWSGPSPGALHRADEAGARWTYEVDYPFPYENGVWRLTYMVRFKGRLYAGIQDYDGREPNDFLVVAPPPDTKTIGREHVRAVKVTTHGAAQTLRWWVDTAVTPTRLYWIAWSRDEGTVLRVSTDGERFHVVPLPAGDGPPTDVKRAGTSVVVLTARALHVLEGRAIDGPGPLGEGDLDGDAVRATTRTVARVPDWDPPKKQRKPSPFDLTDGFCAAPLAVFRGEIYAGGQRGGSLWKLAAAP